MKALLIFGGLVVCVLLLDKFYAKLPKPLQLLYDLWMKFAHILGAVMSRIILTILWIIGFGPYAVIGKLRQSKKSTNDTYWIDAEDQANQDMRFQF